MHPVDRLLQWPWLYKLSQSLWYRSGRQEEYVREWIRPRSGDRVLDIGCGPATLRKFMPSVDYHGYDPNSRYIEDARANYGGLAHFTCGYLTQLPPNCAGSFDLVLANGVMHHLSDPEADEMLRLAASALKPGGRFITRDGCYEPRQTALVQFLLSADRGKFVRTRTGYEDLVTRHLSLLRVEIHHDLLRLPYSLILCEAMKRPPHS